MSDVNGNSKIQENHPRLTQDEIDALTAIYPDAEKFTFGGVTIDNPKTPDDPNAPSVTASIGGMSVNNSTQDDSWEISAFGFEMNERDDVYTVGLVLLVALLIYVAKSSIDHWFNKRLERYRIKLEKSKK